MKNKIKIYILLYIQIIAYLYGYYAPKKITNSGNSSTRIKQTYRFDQIPDDGSYTLSIEDISLELLLNFNEEKISVLTDSDHHDVEISGTLSSFIFYASTGGSDLFSSKITITGDIESANALNSFFKESNLLRIIVIELIGQKPTSTIFSIFDPLKNKLKESNESNNESLSNFLKYDINLIPTKQEINDYLDQVDEIKTRTEKLVKKLK